MSKNTLDLPGMVISARKTTTDDAEFAAYAAQVEAALNDYNNRHSFAAEQCRSEIRAAITAFGVERNETLFRSALTAIYDRMQQDNANNATKFNFELAQALSQLRQQQASHAAHPPGHAWDQANMRWTPHPGIDADKKDEII